MHLRTDPCVVNQSAEGAAPGTTQRCSLNVNPSLRGLSPQEWGDQLKAAGQPIEFWFYEDAAHGILFGPIDRGMRTYGSGPSAARRYGWIGASPDAANRFTVDLMRVIKASYP